MRVGKITFLLACCFTTAAFGMTQGTQEEREPLINGPNPTQEIKNKLHGSGVKAHCYSSVFFGSLALVTLVHSLTTKNLCWWDLTHHTIICATSIVMFLYNLRKATVLRDAKNAIS